MYSEHLTVVKTRTRQTNGELHLYRHCVASVAPLLQFHFPPPPPFMKPWNAFPFFFHSTWLGVLCYCFSTTEVHFSSIVFIPQRGILLRNQTHEREEGSYVIVLFCFPSFETHTKRRTKPCGKQRIQTDRCRVY